MKKLSFIIPCYRSEDTIRPVIDEIVSVVESNHNYTYEIICINDCSPDNVFEVLKDIATNNHHVKVINLAKNMNKPGAEMAGLSKVSGDYVVFLDDDGQCPIPNIWKMIDKLDEGYDACFAKYTEYKQSLFKNFGTIVNRKMTEYVIGKPKEVTFTNFAVIKRYIIDEMVKYKNPYPYMEGILLGITRNITNIPMEERKRMEGTSTFTFKKLLGLWLNGFTAFSIKPLRLSSIIGVIIALLGFIYGLIMIIKKIINPLYIVEGYTSLIAILLFVSGIIMILLGMIGEYVGRIYICLNNTPQYVIKEEINFDKDKDNEKR